MTPSFGTLTLVNVGGDPIVGEWRLDGEQICVRLGDKDFRVEPSSDMRSQVYWFVRFLEEHELRAPVELRACVNCMFFRMSAMALDMAHGHFGKCKCDNSDVRILHSCDKRQKGHA